MEWLLSWIQDLQDKVAANYNQHRTCILVAAGLFLFCVLVLIF